LSRPGCAASLPHRALVSSLASGERKSEEASGRKEKNVRERERGGKKNMKGKGKRKQGENKMNCLFL
jgi:hypothetical protein